ncbi:hypothetical protein [Legionella sp. W05-934-2]|jgi:hypothetical protein|uniref:hypothetical protein n=1 Tax=Legionella sp. W05-934-2 TaxID=1198649 RepID=UPI003462C7C2
MSIQEKHSSKVCLLNIIAFITAYYISVLCHEWGHGLVAWLYGLKSSPFSVHYGGWFLLNVDENVDYNLLFQQDSGTAAALIGIAGPFVSLVILLISLWTINRKNISQQRNLFIFAYWFLVFNMLPLIQYLTVSLFAIQGDTNRFVEGLSISRWWVFIPGTIFNIYMIQRIMRIEIIKAYLIMPIKERMYRNIMLFFTLFVMFWFIYAGGFNPLSAEGLMPLSRYLAIFSIALVPILFIVCNPMRDWVKKRMVKNLT